jgi:DNA-binding MarR family transcriptional regulator
MDRREDPPLRQQRGEVEVTSPLTSQERSAFYSAAALGLHASRTRAPSAGSLASSRCFSSRAVARSFSPERRCGELHELYDPSSGRLYEIDLFLLSRQGLFLVEIKSHQVLAALKSWKPQVDEGEDRDEDAEVLEGPTEADLATEVGVTKTLIKKALKKLEAGGLVEKLSGRPARYVATGDGA